MSFVMRQPGNIGLLKPAVQPHDKERDDSVYPLSQTKTPTKRVVGVAQGTSE